MNFSERWFTFLTSVGKERIDWSSLSRNPLVTPSLISQHIDYPWDFKNVSLHPNITEEFVQDHIQQSWSWSALAKHPNVSISFLLDNKEHWIHKTKHLEYIYLIVEMFKNPNLTCETFMKHYTSGQFEFVLKELGEKRMFSLLTVNPSITSVDIETHPHLPWDWTVLGNNSNVSISLIEHVMNTHHDISSSFSFWDNLLSHPLITLDFLLTHIPSYLVELVLSSSKAHTILHLHPTTTWETVQEFPDMDWNYYLLSSNSNITWNIVKENIDLPWNWKTLSQRLDITEDIVLSHPDVRWVWRDLCSNPSISFSFMEEHCTLSKDDSALWEEISKNKCILPEHIILYQDRFHWTFLCRNTFDEWKRRYEQEQTSLALSSWKRGGVVDDRLFDPHLFRVILSFI